MPRLTHRLVSLAFGLCLATGASAATIGVVAPKNGPYAMLGAQILDGARAAAGEDTLVEVEESCEQGSGKQIAQKLKDAKVSIAVGFLCVETLSETLPILKDAGIAALTVSVRSKILMEDSLRYGWPFFRLAPVDGEEGQKLADTILSQWQTKSIALVDDGTIYGRDLVSVIRQRLETGGIKPAFTDTLRPGQEQQLSLVRRLAKTGATHVFVGADRNDVAIMARDVAGDNLGLTFLGGDALRAANRPVALKDGVLAVALPDYALLPEAANAVVILRTGNIEPDGYVLPAFAAVQVASEAAKRMTSQNITASQSLTDSSTETVIGRLRIGKDHELVDNPYRLQEWRGGSFRPVGPATE
ncbi:branched-chain amino acid ABC transporter substrate-binding protein [Rhizobium oryzicola]|uniref:Branched-chain amino acid ABC transporter substrate-binding protein n=1 Tax=Rhizobium oryzicola TaxID=1232668 RepID=A0ABT8T192_9HYPH|nr:branched-chain amino acid ABC transporter substrate-binding protein [Rhizobium oryzicola]MDO1584520.1 branched-chain amino acid ABC transporter substrate-binding protein [Rhizobium oryzicola]